MIMTHKLIKKTAMEMAAAHYEQMAKHDLFYRRWPDQDDYIEIAWVVFLPEAKSSLANMLTLPSIPQHWKDEIHEALVKHHDLQVMQQRLDNAGATAH